MVVALVGAVMAVVVVAPLVRVVVVAMVGGDGGSRCVCVCVCVCVDRPTAARARGAWQERSAAHSSMRSESKHARNGNKLWSQLNLRNVLVRQGRNARHRKEARFLPGFAARALQLVRCRL